VKNWRKARDINTEDADRRALRTRCALLWLGWRDRVLPADDTGICEAIKPYSVMPELKASLEISTISDDCSVTLARLFSS
jgi:hypothetical protein